ncbi:RNA polymerase sigma factor [Rubinisphaera margarita]|uniref:RNA polymerase sigma factor n=1 Tax=Rubinisphaera margarita TaxID=2909586 RepID=UPI001EE8385B|nr:sigma-70 family RNA polymerase sigma factor [Rubinisphaera margarita]MCG6157745.1 sigma-70 family RNA polymerase sigma factor [Rubinisphaera margarita]
MAEQTTGTAQLEDCIARLNAGDSLARGELLNLTCERLLRLTHHIKQSYPSVARWEQTDDILQTASMKLYEALHNVELNDARHFFRLAAKKIRETLLDLARHYQGPMGVGANHATMPPTPADQSQGPSLLEAGELTCDPRRVAEWTEMHKVIESLPDESKEMFDLLWYHEMSQEEAASIIGISVRQVKRRWRDAKLLLAERMNGEAPSVG